MHKRQHNVLRFYWNLCYNPTLVFCVYIEYCMHAIREDRDRSIILTLVVPSGMNK